jgi:rhodanese-related sulfurtransferase
MSFFTSIPSVSVTEAAEATRATDTVLIDVRTPEEYREIHAQGALNCPLPSLASCLSKLAHFKTVYVICQSGGRSARAVTELIAQHINAKNVSGGTLAWRTHGLPIA